MKTKNLEKRIEEEPYMRFSAFDTYLKKGTVRIDPENCVISMESSSCAMVTRIEKQENENYNNKEQQNYLNQN